MRRASIALALLLSPCLGCGDGSLVLVGDGEDGNTQDTIVVQGNIRDINPQVAGARIVVFVFTDLDRPRCSSNDDCSGSSAPSCIENLCQHHPNDFDHFEKQRSDAVDVETDPVEFSVTKVSSGDLTIVFLQDDVSNPDGRIDEGDLHAVLKEPEDVLDDALNDVRNGDTIRLTDIDIDFATDDSGSAEARSVRSGAIADEEPE